jgi:ParB-like chromosome segregation protein Spo0J
MVWFTVPLASTKYVLGVVRSYVQWGDPGRKWVQPILITREGTIIDGFHRTRLAIESPALKARYAGKVPCAVLDVTRDKAMILTIRMNRAKGSHVAVRMSEIVRELIDVHHCDPQEVAIEIGATKEEIETPLPGRRVQDEKYRRLPV